MNSHRSNSSSNFARTCSRLSQFLKERRRSFGDQSCLAFPHMAPAPSPKPDPKRVEEEIGKKKGIMSLFPEKMEKEEKVPTSQGPGENFNSWNLCPLTSPSTKEESPKTTTNLRELPRSTEEPKTPTASMTIFYAGKVLVFDEFPEDKAQEVILLATQGVTKSTNAQTSIETQTQTQTKPQTLASPSNSNMVTTQDKQDTVSQEADGPSDLPIARRTSLFRFIEKRKDRVASAAPYQVRNMANSNPQRYNAVMRNLCQQQQEEQKQKQLLELKL